MAKAKKTDEGIVYVTAEGVEVNLDADPNDPRHATPAGPLPSLNDADQN